MSDGGTFQPVHDDGLKAYLLLSEQHPKVGMQLLGLSKDASLLDLLLTAYDLIAPVRSPS